MTHRATKRKAMGSSSRMSTLEVRLQATDEELQKLRTEKEQLHHQVVEYQKIIEDLDERNRKLGKEIVSLEEKKEALEKELKQQIINKQHMVYVVAEPFEENKYDQMIATSKKLIESGEGEHILQKLKAMDLMGSKIILPIADGILGEALTEGTQLIVNNQGIIEGTEGLYKGGEYMNFQRILRDSRWELSDEHNSNRRVVRPIPGFQGVKDVHPGDTIRFVGDLALENCGQPSFMDALTYKPERVDRDQIVGVRWNDILDDCEEKIDIFFNEIQSSPGVRVPYLGIAFTGLPGVGKTLSARYISWYTAVKFNIEMQSCMFSAKVGEIYSSYLNRSQANIVNLFKRVRKKSDELGIAILFIDEYDQFININDNDPESAWKKNNVLQCWKQELQEESLTNVLIVCTLNDSTHLGEAISRRFQDNIYTAYMEMESVPILVNHLLDNQNINGSVDREGIIDGMMHFLKSYPLGKLEFSNRHFRDFYPCEITSYADLKAILISEMKQSRHERRSLEASDVLDRATKMFREKASRIKVRVENGYHRNNSREFFSSLSDEEFSNLHQVIVYDHKHESVENAFVSSNLMEDI